MITSTTERNLNNILKDIKKVNDTRLSAGENTISEDDDNGILLTIFCEYLQDGEDSEDFLTRKFGQEGYEKIRDAEQGNY